MRKAINGHITRAREVAVTMLGTDEVQDDGVILAGVKNNQTPKMANKRRRSEDAA